MKFLIYKIYRLAMSQEATTGTEFSFLMFMTVFLLLHLLFLVLLIKIIGFGIQLPEGFGSLFGFLFLIISSGLNYFIFIRKGRIYEINRYYRSKNISVVKENLIFFGYLLVLFLLLFAEAVYFIKYE